MVTLKQKYLDYVPSSDKNKELFQSLHDNITEDKNNVTQSDIDMVEKPKLDNMRLEMDKELPISSQKYTEDNTDENIKTNDL